MHFHATSLAFDTWRQHLHRHRLLQDLQMRGFAAIFSDFINIVSTKTTFSRTSPNNFVGGPSPSPSVTSPTSPPPNTYAGESSPTVTANWDGSPTLIHRHKGASPTPSSSTPIPTPPSTFAGESSIRGGFTIILAHYNGPRAFIHSFDISIDGTAVVGRPSFMGLRLTQHLHQRTSTSTTTTTSTTPSSQALTKRG